MNVQPTLQQPRTFARDAADLGIFVLSLVGIVLMAVLALVTLRDQTFWTLAAVAGLLAPLPVLRACAVLLRDEQEGAERERMQREAREAGQRAQGGGAADDLEAMNTDGKGTGGVGADGGGYGPVPGSDATG